MGNILFKTKVKPAPTPPPPQTPPEPPAPPPPPPLPDYATPQVARGRRQTTTRPQDERILMRERLLVQSQIPDFDIRQLGGGNAFEFSRAERQELARRAIMAELQSKRLNKFMDTQEPSIENKNRLALAQRWYDVKDRGDLHYDFMDEGNSGGYYKDENGKWKKVNKKRR